MEEAETSKSWLHGADVPRTTPPLAQVQNDWQEVCKAKQGSFWVSYKQDANTPTKHGKVRVIPDSDPLQFDSEEGFKVNVDLKKRRVHITSPDDQHTTVLQTNAFLMNQIHQEKSVNAIDISPAGELGVTGSDDGVVRVWQTKDGVMRRDLQGHVGDINTVQWFPSGQVVLTGSSDYQLKIWDVVKGECGATLKGHAGGILGTAIIERGRNVVSCSRDGTARLWDVSTQTTITVFGEKPFLNPSANHIFVSQNPLPLETPTKAAHAKEVGTEGKLLLVAREDGVLQGFDIRNRKEIFHLRGSSALNTCLLVNQHSILAGAEDGLIIHWDIRRNTTSPRSILQRSHGPITDITITRGEAGHETRCWASTKDGLFFEWDIESQKILTELSGADFNAINGIAVHGDLAFAVEKQGILKYRLSE